MSHHTSLLSSPGVCFQCFHGISLVSPFCVLGVPSVSILFLFLSTCCLACDVFSPPKCVTLRLQVSFTCNGVDSSILRRCAGELPYMPQQSVLLFIISLHAEQVRIYLSNTLHARKEERTARDPGQRGADSWCHFFSDTSSKMRNCQQICPPGTNGVHPLSDTRSQMRCCQRKLAEASANFISVDNVRALVTMSELERYKEVHGIFLPKFDREYTEACVIEGEEVLTIRPEERGTQKLFFNTYKIPKETWRWDWVVLCQNGPICTKVSKKCAGR